MKEKALLTTLLLCMIISSILMVFVLKGIDSVRWRSANIGPGGYNSLVQLDYVLDSYGNALKQYQINIDDPEQRRQWALRYQHEFDVVWGNLSQFSIRFMDSTDTQDMLKSFQEDAQLFLQDAEPAMTLGSDLDKAGAKSALDNLRTLQIQLHTIGQDYFVIWLTYRDNWVNNLNKLHDLLLFFAAVLVAAAGLFATFLIRSNLRKNHLIKEAEEARAALSSTVAELRSGRVEQRAKDSFIAAASHDLRQPLHALGLFLGSLEKHVKGENGRHMLHEAIQCSNDLGSLFNSLLDLSRLDAGIVNVAKQHFELDLLIVNLQHEFQANSKSSAVNIVVKVAKVVVYSDPILLSRIIRNLIENALKHSGADTITVTCTQKNKTFKLQVSDNGCGIAKSNQKQVFLEYYQIENRPTGVEKGLGLGLSIVKRLSDLLEMPLALHSDVGSSTTFTMEIPAGNIQNMIQTAQYTLTAPSSMRDAEHIIAIIDDDEKICSAMSSMIESIGLEAVTATSADALIDKLIESQKTPELVIADYRLQKGITGDQAIMQLRRALNLDIPGLLITGDTSPVHVGEAAKSGFELLHKPVQSAELANKIFDVLLAAQHDSANDAQRRNDGDTREVV